MNGDAQVAGALAVDVHAHLGLAEGERGVHVSQARVSTEARDHLVGVFSQFSEVGTDQGHLDVGVDRAR